MHFLKKTILFLNVNLWDERLTGSPICLCLFRLATQRYTVSKNHKTLNLICLCQLGRIKVRGKGRLFLLCVIFPISAALEELVRRTKYDILICYSHIFFLLKSFA